MSRASEYTLPGDIVIQDAKKREHILRQFAHWVHAKFYEDNCPVMMPVSLTHENLFKLTRDEYVVSEKSDGVRYTLVMGVYKRKPYSVLVDRGTNLFEIDVAAQRRFFEGTVLDGELVWDFKAARQRFLVFDVPSIAGNWIGERNYLDRYKAIEELVGLDGNTITSIGVDKWLPYVTRMSRHSYKIISVGNKHQLGLERKACVPLRFLPTLWRQITQSALTHSCDGLIFTPVQKNFHVGRNRGQLKFKPMPTIDLAWKNNCLYLAAEEDGELVTATYQTVHPIILERNTLMSRTLLRYAATNKKAIIVECKFHVPKELQVDTPTTGMVFPIVCTPVRVRDDKTVPNSTETVTSMITEIVSQKFVSIVTLMQTLSNAPKLALTEEAPTQAPLDM